MNGVGGLLDRYVLRRFLGAYGLCLFGFLMLFLVIDFSTDVDKFVEAAPAVQKAGLSMPKLVLEYYATKIPWMTTLIGPFLTLFAAIAALITFGRHNEILPMIASGRSHHRVLAPIYVCAALLVAALVGVEEFVAPPAMKRNAAISELFDEHDRGSKPPHLRDAETGNKFDAATWEPARQRLVDVHAPAYHDPSGRLPDGRFDAAALVFRRNKETGQIGWFPAEGGTLTPDAPDGGGALPAAIRLQPDRPVAFRTLPAEIDLSAASAEPGLSWGDLSQLIALHPQKYDLQMQMFTRTTRPVSSLVLLLLGLPFVMRAGQKSIAEGLGIALGTCAAYMAVDFFFQQLGNRGALFVPMISAWFAPAFFGALALCRLDRVGR